MIIVQFLNTSGDLNADRRFEFARGLAEEEQDFAAAIDILEQTLEIAPHWPVLYYSLGRYYKALQRNDCAIKYFKQCREIDPDDRQGAALELERLGIQAITDNMPPAFVETLFDQYAERFDTHLVETLDYQVPILISGLIKPLYKYRKDLRILDLGCGTGLAGEHLRDYAAHLEGVDLSGGMLEKAEEKCLYDALIQAELLEYLQSSESSYDIIIAADVLSYFGALDGVLTGVKERLKTGGHFIFSAQALSAPPPAPSQPDFYLGRARRFSHAKEYLELSINSASLKLIALHSAILRKDEGENVKGYLIISSK